VVAIDFLSRYTNLSLAKFDGTDVDALKKTLPPFCVFDNPIDLTGSADAALYGKALEFMGGHGGTDIIMPFFVYQDAPLAATVDEMHRIMLDSQKHGKTLLGVAGGADFTRKESVALQKDGIPMIPTARRAMSALSKVVQYAEWRRKNG